MKEAVSFHISSRRRLQIRRNMPQKDEMLDTRVIDPHLLRVTYMYRAKGTYGRRQRGREYANTDRGVRSGRAIGERASKPKVKLLEFKSRLLHLSNVLLIKSRIYLSFGL